MLAFPDVDAIPPDTGGGDKMELDDMSFSRGEASGLVCGVVVFD